MRLFSRLAPLVLALALASCESETAVPPIPTGLRVVNAFTGPVDVLIDGNVAISAMAAGTIETTKPSNGTHTVTFIHPDLGKKTITVDVKSGQSATAAVRFNK